MSFRLSRHLRIKLKQLFETLGVVLETAADIYPLKRFIIALMGGAEVLRHGLGVIEVSNGGGEMRLPGEEYVLGATRQVCLVFLGELRDGEGVPAKGVGVRKISTQANTNCSYPNPM